MKDKNDRKKSNSHSVNRNREIARLGVFIALALILSYLENLVPIHFVVPGVKLGLANLVTIIALFQFRIGDTVMISVGRIVLSSVLFGNLAVMLYSLAGAFCSIVVMMVMKKCKIFSVTGVSVGGAVSHNLGQIIVAVIVMENIRIFYYLTVLVLTGTLAGTAIGFLAVFLLKNIRFNS